MISGSSDTENKPFSVTPVLAGVLAALVYGSWAAFVNSEHGTAMSVKAGLGQGSYALFSTWIVTAAAIRSLNYFGYAPRDKLLAFTLTFLIMLMIPVVIHALLGTEDVLEAITPGLIWGSFYIGAVLRIQQPPNTGLES